MARRRWVDAEHPAYDPGSCDADGRAQCRRCLAPLPHPHAMFCGPACLHEYRIRTNATYARQAVYRRDRGVCTQCRLDAGLIDRVIARLRGRHPSEVPMADPDAPHADNEVGDRTALWLLNELGLGRRTRPCSAWQMDHRIPYSDGGADCGLGNLRTLCLTCHRRETRAFHRRLKAQALA